ncbi:MAG: hypothetical protein SFW36_06605, partial [Leptolyngbyaceae cyanobacterium bins.59]|nr:hypothetical protein [Leptolyngbyaceae cyanobacterium bins.59]
GDSALDDKLNQVCSGNHQTHPYPSQEGIRLGSIAGTQDLQMNAVPVTGLRLRSALDLWRVERSQNPIHRNVCQLIF